MTKTEVTELLALIQAFDRRTVGEADVEAWALILRAVDVTDAADAVSEYFREETKWLMPAEVHNRARRILRSRLGQERNAELEAARTTDIGPEGELTMAGLVEAGLTLDGLAAKPGQTFSERQQRVRAIFTEAFEASKAARAAGTYHHSVS